MIDNLKKGAQLAYTGLNKKTTTIVLGTAIGLITIIVAYAMFGDDTPEQKAKAEKKSEQVSGQNISIIVNNIMDSASRPIAVKKTVASTPIAPPVALPKTLPATSSAPMAFMQPPVIAVPSTTQAQPAKPKMLVVDSNSASSSDKNAISGTDTSVGTGEITTNMRKQRSPYTLFAGTGIPCQMVQGLNSEVNGMITCRVYSDVYDSTEGKYLLIPQGSTAVGTYNKDVAYGFSRLMAGWNRLIYPNGTSILLHGQPGTDLEGYSGLTGEVNNHYGQVFGSAAIMGGIMGADAAAMGNQGANPYTLSPGAVISQQVAGQLGQAGIQVVQRGLNIPPTIIVPPGTKIRIQLTADLVLKPYIYR